MQESIQWGVEEQLTVAWALSNLLLLVYFQRTRKFLESVIGEQTKARDAQNQAQKDLESLLNGVPYMLGYWDKTLHNRFSNKAYAQWLGITPDSLLNKHISEFLNPTRLATAMPLIKKALQGTHCEYTVELKQEGPEKPSHLLVQYLPDVTHGEVAGFYTIGQDISEQFQAEQKLALRQKLLQLTGEIGRVGGIFIDPASGTVNLTHEAKYLLNTQRSRYSSIAEFCAQHVEAGQADVVRGAFLSALDAKSKVSIEFGTAGEKHDWLRCLGEPVTIQDKPSYLLCLMDMTESHRARMQLLQAKQLSDQTNEMKSRFVATMSHEIRNPLHAMTGLCSLLEDHCETDTQKDLTNKLKSCSNDLVELLNNTLDAFKLARGEMEVETAPFDLWALTAGVSDYLFGCAGQKNLTLSVRLAPGTARHWMGDAFRLKQITNNLLSNASKFTTQGTIEVSFSQTPSSRLGVEVRDTGMGIPSESIEKLFSDTAQGSTATARLYGGSGLGLHLVKKLVEHLGGTIALQSEVGLGTCIQIELPWPTAPATHHEHDEKPTDVLLRMQPGTARITSLEIAHMLGLQVETESDRLVDTSMRVITDDPDWALTWVQTNSGSHCLITPHGDGTSRHTPGREQHDRIQWMQGPMHPLAVAQWLKTGWKSPALSTQMTDKPEAVEDKLVVLIAEDVAISRLVMREILKKRGVTCLEAENGQEAMEHMLSQGENIDFVFMDINMPIMNGYEATAMIREHAQLKNMTIYALTGEDQHNTEQCRDWSIFDDVFKKPMRFDKLEELLVKHQKQSQLSG